MKVVICDDEQYWISKLEHSISKWANARKVDLYISTFVSPQELFGDLTIHKDIDVLFLDIAFGKGVADGISLAKRLRIAGCSIPIIFVTVDSFKATEGYLVEAMGYLTKPIDEGRLCFFLDRLHQQKIKCCHNRIRVTYNGWVSNIYQNEIVYVEIMNHTIIYHTTKGNISCRGTLREVLATLHEDFFIQIHRSYIVAIDKIINIKTTYPYSITLLKCTDKITLSVSRKYINPLIEKYTEDVWGKII